VSLMHAVLLLIIFNHLYIPAAPITPVICAVGHIMPSIAGILLQKWAKLFVAR
jgi:hypothetical protein